MINPSQNDIKKWKILAKLKEKKKKFKVEDLLKILLENRGLKTSAEKKEFFHPKNPEDLSLPLVGLKKSEVARALKRIKKAKLSGEKVIVYGDYDADGITATAILWENLNAAGLNASPYIPDRFSEGYGFNLAAIKKLKKEDKSLGLVITVDHGVTAVKQVELCKKIGIDVIICDHHRLQKIKPKPYAFLHTLVIGGAEIAWVLSREIRKSFKIPTKNLPFGDGLDLAGIGVVADILPLLGPNRSFAKYGIEALNKTQRPGLLRLYEEANLKPGEINTRQVGYMIAPRINAMGRLRHGLESLRLLCFRKDQNAKTQAQLVGETNRERRKIEEEVLIHAEKSLQVGTSEKIIVIAHESYHEGVIGLAASRIVETFHRPAIVFAKKKGLSKASARSISGFDIFQAIISLKEEFNIEGGGHAMAAGFSLETSKIELFTKRIKKLAEDKIADEILAKKLIIDAEIRFNQINLELFRVLTEFEPTGAGNYLPVFATRKVNITEAQTVGSEKKHLKLKVEKDGISFAAIAFEKGALLTKLAPDKPVDIGYQITLNKWNGYENLELMLKDIRI